MSEPIQSCPSKPTAESGKESTTQNGAGPAGQVHQRNRTASRPSAEGYTGVPPGEEGQYGMRRDASPHDDAAKPSHSASERDSNYARWRAEHPDGEGTLEDFEQWRRAQTAPGTNIRAPDAERQSVKK